MALIQDLGPNYSVSQYANTSERANTFYTNNITMNLSYWTEATYDLRMFIGEQGLMTELYGVLPGRPHMYSFNRILRVVNTITGFQRRNRKSLTAIPVENSQQQTADQLSKILFWADQQESIGETISDAFEGACVTGMYLLHAYMDYRKDPISGDLKVESVPYNSFIMDTFTRKSDLSDCNGIMRRSFVTKETAMSLLPDYTKEIRGMEGGQGARDAKFQYMPEVFAFDQNNQLTYDEFYYRSFRRQRMIVDRVTGQTMEWRSSNDDILRLYLQRYPSVTIIEQEIPTVRQAILVNNNTVFDELFELDEYPFIPVMTYFNPEVPFWNWRVQGIVRQLRDAQYLYNRRMIASLDHVENKVTGAFAYKPAGLINTDDIYQTGGGRHIPVKDGFQIADVIQPLPTPDIPQSWAQMSEALAKEVQEISGVNEAMLGSATDEKAGILEMLRQGAGITMLQGVYDKLDRSCKQLGRLMIKLVQNNFTPGKVQQIIKEQPTEEFYHKNFSKYDCAVEEGSYTTTQRQNQFITLIKLREIGVPIPDEALLEATTIQDKTKIVEQIQKTQQQAAQMQQQQQQVAMQELQSRAQLCQARAKADTGLFFERTSRVQENLAAADAKVHEAAKDDDVALLNLVKAMKEIESLDINHVKELLTMAQSLKQQEQVEQQATQMPQQAKPESSSQSRGLSSALQGQM